MIQSSKMIYQPPKYHTNSFSHLLQLHSSINGNSNSILHSNRMIGEESQSDDRTKLEIHDHSSNTSNTSLEVVSNDSIGKSFTIAAILGLKKNSVNPLHALQARQNCEIEENSSVINDYNAQDFPNIINLTTHSKLFQKFDNDNRHNYILQQSSENSSSQMPLEQCIYDNNNITSNSSYQEHLHKQHNTSDFNVNYNRNINEMNSQSGSAMRNHIHSSANLLNKAFARERSGRMGTSKHLISTFLNF